METKRSKALNTIEKLRNRRLKAKTRTQQDRTIMKTIYCIIEKYDLLDAFNMSFKRVEYKSIIEVNNYQWFDKTYGNTYNKTICIIDDVEIFTKSMYYGYGEHYKDITLKELKKLLPDNKDIQSVSALWHLQEKGYKLIFHNYENCKLKEVK